MSPTRPSLTFIIITVCYLSFITHGTSISGELYTISSFPKLFSGLQIIHPTPGVTDITCAIICSQIPGCVGFAHNSRTCYALDDQPLGKNPYVYTEEDRVYFTKCEVRILAYRTSTGTTDSPYAVLASSETSGNITLSGDLDIRLSTTFKHWITERWTDLQMSKIDMAFRTSNGELRHIIFNASTTENKMAWLNKMLLLSAPWNDLSTSSETNIFSIYGSLKRRFFINKNYGGCDRDTGWFVLLESNKSCWWESRHPTHPAILYSTSENAVLWRSANVGVATDLLLLAAVSP